MPMTLLRCCAVLLATGVATSVLAQAAPGASQKLPRLERIAATNQFVIGHREAAAPFAFFDGEQMPAGYGVDIATAIAGAVREKLGRPNLPIRFNSLTLVTRFPLVVNGVVDIECGSTTNTLERQRTVMFSNTIFISVTRIAVPSASSVRGFDDLAGKRVAVVADTTTEARVRMLAAARKLDFQLLPARNNLRAFQALQRGDADAFVAGEALLAGEIARSDQGVGFRVVGEPIEREAFACVMPPNQPEFKALVDATLARMMASGELARLYDKWFVAPIPPRQRGLGLPLSPEMRALFAAPDDRPIE